MSYNNHEKGVLCRVAGRMVATIAMVAAQSVAVQSVVAQNVSNQAMREDRAMWASAMNVSNAVLKSEPYYYNDLGKFLVSWRMLPSDGWQTSFDLFRTDLQGGGLTKVNASPIKSSTSFQDTGVRTGSVYYLTYSGEAVSPTVEWLKANALSSCTLTNGFVSDKLPYISIPLQGTDDVCGISTVRYQANDVSVGDLDGDGQMEIVVKRLQTVLDTEGKVVSDGTGASTSVKEARHCVVWDAYRLDGSLMWRIKSGPNVMLGNSSSFAVADLDGDGCAEMAIRTAEGTVFGDGQEIGDTDGDGKTDYRTWTGGYIDHYCSAGPEFLSVIDGKTGRELARTDYIPRGASTDWGDDYFKRANSHRIGVGCFDRLGRLSIVLGRGVYERSVLEAWDYSDGALTRRWHFDTSAPGGADKNKDGKPNSAYAAQGNHSFNVGDLDGDGLDEVMYGSMAIDDDGCGLWTTGLGHGDANMIGKFLPDREGLQMFHCLESGKTMVALHDAATGKVIWSKSASEDNDMGRCCVADIDPSSSGCEFWYYGSNAFSQDGQTDLGYKPKSCNMSIWFDGSLSRQLINEGIIQSQAHGRTFTMYRYDLSFINGTKSNPSWYGDMLGDWREEVIVPDATKLVDLKVFSTWYPSGYKFPWLMTDHNYLMGVINENIGYNQTPFPSYYIGTDLVASGFKDVPVSEYGTNAVRSVERTDKPSGKIYDLTGREVKGAGSVRGLYVRDGRLIMVR